MTATVEYPTRYTFKRLTADIEDINARNAAAGVKLTLKAGLHRNRTHLFVCGETYEWNHRSIARGRPIVCLSAAHKWTHEQLTLTPPPHGWDAAETDTPQ